MALKIIAAAPARDPATVHAFALCVLDELTADLDKTFALAAAGARYCDRPDRVVEGNLFQLMEERLGSNANWRRLRQQISELAEMAGCPAGS